MPTKEEKQSSSGGGSASGGTTTVNSTNTTTSSGSGSGNNSCSSEKHKYCLLCNRNDFTLNTFNATIEKDLRAIFNTEIKFKENRKVCLQCLLSIKLLKRSNKDGHIKQKSGDCCKDLFDNVTYFQELRNKYQRYVNRLIDNRKDSSKKSSSSESSSTTTTTTSTASSLHSPVSTNNSPASSTTTSPDVINTTPSSTSNNSSNSNTSTSSKHLTKLNDKSSSSTSSSPLSSKSSITNGKSVKPSQTDVNSIKCAERIASATVNSSSQSVATNTNTPIVVKTKERAGEREREKEKDSTKTSTATVVKSNGTASSASPSPTIKNKAQLKLLPKHIDNVATTVAAATATTCAAVSEIVKQKSLKPENCIKEKLINGTGKSHHDGASSSSSTSSSSSSSSSSSKSNNRRTIDRKVTENEPLSCNEKTKLSNNPSGIVVVDKTKVAVIQLEKSQSIEMPPPPPPPTQSSTANKVIASAPVAQQPSPSPVNENKDEVDAVARTKSTKLPTNTKRTRVQRSSSPKRSVTATIQTPTRQQRNCTFEQAICHVQNPEAKQKTDEPLAVKTVTKSQTPTVDKSSLPPPATSVAEKKNATDEMRLCPPVPRPLRPSTEKFEYTIINGMKIEVPQRVTFDKKMFTCFVRMNDKPNSKRKANGQLADATPEPVAKKRKNAASKNSKVERPKQPPTPSIEPIESIKVAEATTSTSTSTPPPPPTIPLAATATTSTTIVESEAVETLAATTIETEAESVSCNQNETPRSILQKCDRSKALLESKKRVSFTGVPLSPPSSPEVNTERTLPPSSDADESMQSTEISVNDVKIVSDTKKVDEIQTKSEKPKKAVLRPPTPPPPAFSTAVAAATATAAAETPAVTTKENVTNVVTPPKVVGPTKKVVDATQQVVEAIKPIVVPEKLAVTPIEERLRPKKKAKHVEKSSTKSSKSIEPKSVASEVQSTTKIVDDLAVAPAATPTPSTTTNVEKNTSKSLASPNVVQQSKIAASVSIDNNNAISICADEKPDENSLILESSIITAVEEVHNISDTDVSLDRSTPKSIKKKRKPYTKRTKAIKSVASEKETAVVTATATPSKTRGRPPKRKHHKHKQTQKQITSDTDETVEANSVAIVNLEEIKRNNVLDDYCDYPVVQRSTCVPIMLDDKDEDDVKMVMEDDPLAVETDGICASSMSSTQQRMPLPMPLLIHRPPEITPIISPSKQQQQQQHQHSPNKKMQPSTSKTSSPTIQHQPESTRSSPGKTMTTNSTSHENIRLKISNGKVTDISPSKSNLMMTSTTISNSPKAGVRNRTKRMRKKKQHKDFVVSDATGSDESDDESPTMTNDRKKRPKYLHESKQTVNETCLANAAELSVVSDTMATNDSVDQTLMQVSPVSSAAASAFAAAAAAAMEVSPIASPQYSPVLRQPESSTFETMDSTPMSMPTTSTTTQQILHATPIQYDERVFRAYVLVDKIPQVNNDNVVNTTASAGAETCNVNATTVQSTTTATHVITQPVSISIPMPMATSVSMSSSPHQNNHLSNEPIADAIENFSQHLHQLQAMHQHQNNHHNSSNSGGGCDPHSIESFVESCQQFEHCMESIESEANSMNVIQNYTTLNDGLNDGVYELQDGTLCENVESPSMPIVAAENAGGTIIGFESPATVDSTTSGYSSATATSSVYLVDTGTLNQTIEMSNGFNAADFNMHNMQLESFPFVEIQTSDIIDILGKPTNDCGESLNMENISLDSTVPTATTDDTRTWLLTDSNGQPILNTINTVATVQALPTTITTGNIFGVFRTKASLKQIDPLPMQLQINTDGTHFQLSHQQQHPLAHQQQQLQQQQQQLHQIINMHGHSHHNHGTVAIPNDISAKMLRTDNPILNAVISSNDESSEMHDATESFSMSVDSMVTSSADSDNVAGGVGNGGNDVNESIGGSGEVNGGVGGGGSTGVNGTHRRPGLNVVFSTPSKRCNNVYLSNENVSIDDFISESNQSLLNPDNFPTTTTTEEPHLDFYTLGM